ncbi:hypothetical protein V8G54_012256 [Vigna mungo]|uniref:Putative plant transposon protein domain-containing protein n=1 Tax=Vigna mungo TaxID=3915 RepID=A0AAQ3NRY4_VIGMU
MASSSNPKRVKTIGHKKDKGKKMKSNIFSHHFLSEKHEEHFQVVQNRRLLMERKVEQLIMEAPQFGDELERRHWLRLLHYPEPASIAIVKEFYANARHFSDGEEPFVSYVRGRRVPFDVATINTFLNTQWPEDIASCEYAAVRVNQFREVDFTNVEHVLCVPEGHFSRNLHGKPLNIRRSFLQPVYKYWVALLHANISPCSHVSDLITSRAVLLYHIIQGQQINLGQCIAQEIFNCAHSANPKAPLGHPSLITHLCALAGVDTSEAPFERPRATINRAYYTQYCLLDEEGLPIPPPPPPRRHRRRGQAPPQQPLGPDQHAPPDYPASHDSFMMVEMRQMMQRLEAKMETQDAKMKVIHRIGRAQAAMMRHAFGASHLDFMTPLGLGTRLLQLEEAMEEDGTEECDSDAGIKIIEEDDDDDSEENGTEVEDVDGDEDDEDDD